MCDQEKRTKHEEKSGWIGTPLQGGSIPNHTSLTLSELNNDRLSHVRFRRVKMEFRSALQGWS